MSFSTPLRASAALATMALLLSSLAVLLSPAPSTAAPTARLSVSPDHYTGGELLTFEGNIGARGKRTVRLQLNLARPGDPWNDIAGTRTTTRRNGDFTLTFKAPAMFGILFRASAKGGLHTPSVRFKAMSQEIVLSTPSQVGTDESFTIGVDTTPNGPGDPSEELLRRRNDLPPPVLVGRTLTLQRRIDTGVAFGYADQWQTIDTGVTDARGEGSFTVRSPATPGTAVYRVRQENWTQGGDDVGWNASFPTYVQVGAGAARRTTSAGPSARPSAAARTAAPVTVARTSAVASKTAAERYQWRPPLFNFNWGWGESLTHRPVAGTKRSGWWLDSASGTGRASKHNGGVLLDTQRQNTDDINNGSVDDSYGTTAVTLRENAQRLGRWEVRLRSKSTEHGDADALVRIELVPENAADYACGARNITIAELSPHGNSFRIGARNGRGDEWSRNISDVSTKDVAHAFAVEVGRRHLTWFREGNPVGHVRSRSAVPRVPMTMRLAIVPKNGRDDQELDRSQAVFDWMRGYKLGEGRQVKKGARLSKGTYTGGC